MTLMIAPSLMAAEAALSPALRASSCNLSSGKRVLFPEDLVKIVKGAADYVVSMAINEHGGYKWACKTSRCTHYDPGMQHGAAVLGLHSG